MAESNFFVKLFSLVALFCGLIIPLFMHFTMKECKHYHIDDQKGKIILITGANSGLGYHTSLHLARAGATVIMACRSSSKCAESRTRILNFVSSKTKIYSMTLDLSSFSSIRQFVENLKSEFDFIDVLINNAGIMALPTRELTEDGLEMQVGTNHFGHFYLTSLLFPIINKDGGRIVNHASLAYKFVPNSESFDDLLSEKSYDPWTAYSKSKLSNILFTNELNHRLQASSKSSQMISISVHPGYTSTNLQTGRFPLSQIFNMLFGMNGEDGALSVVVGAVGDIFGKENTIIGPQYYIFGPPRVDTITVQPFYEEAQKKLWEESERITGQHFDIL